MDSIRKYLRFAALGDSTTHGVGDPVDGGWRGWARLRVNEAYDEIHGRFDTLRIDLANRPEIHTREFWSIDRMHPSELGHRAKDLGPLALKLALTTRRPAPRDVPASLLDAEAAADDLAVPVA